MSSSDGLPHRISYNCAQQNLRQLARKCNCEGTMAEKSSAGADSSMDAANLMKPSLARGELQAP